MDGLHVILILGSEQILIKDHQIYFAEEIRSIINCLLVVITNYLADI